METEYEKIKSIEFQVDDLDDVDDETDFWFEDMAFAA